MTRLPLRFLAGLALAWATGAAPAAEFIALKIRVTPTGHEVLGARRFNAPQVEAGTFSVASDHPLDWQVLDANGKVLSRGAIADPRVTRAPMEPGRAHVLIVKPAAEYILRVPADARASALLLPPLARAETLQASRPRAMQATGETAGVPSQKIDLRVVLGAGR